MGYTTWLSAFERYELNQRNENSLLSNMTLRANIAPFLTASLKGNYNYYGISTLEKQYGTGANYGPSGTGYYGRGGSISVRTILHGYVANNWK